MAGSDEQMRESAGISSPEEIDVAALFARLQEEVRATPAPHAEAPAMPRRLAARELADRYWFVAVDVPIERKPGLRGALVYPIKKLLRKLMSWYVGPFAADQRAFNEAVLRLVDELHDSVVALEERLEARLSDAISHSAATLDERLAGVREDARLLREVEERVFRLERRLRGDAPPGRPNAPGSSPFDYFTFEARMRGTADDIRERQRIYVDDFRDAAPVLDVGCGRGEFLALLAEAGIEARGVDADPEMVAYARAEGLDVAEAEGLAYLEQLDDGSLGGVFAGQLVEHLPPPALVRFLELAARKLRQGGVLVAETINPVSPMALRHYFSDLTHAQPVVAQTLELLARQAGFSETEIRYLHPPEQRLEVPDLPPGPARDALARNVALLNEQLFAPQDYALVARR